MESRTLKDLISTFSKAYQSKSVSKDLRTAFDAGYNFCKEDARQEAIKWIKDLTRGSTSHFRPKKGAERYDLLAWIMYFFNLTEEDLK